MSKLKLYPISLVSCSLIFLLLSLSVFFNKNYQSKLTNFLYPSQRQVLSTLKTNLNFQNKSFKIVKIQKGKDLWIEIYDLKQNEDLMTSFKLASRLDGQMYVNQKTSNLFATDLDEDGVLEVVSPAFSIELQPHVHAFKYNLNDHSFSQMSPEELLKLL